MIRKSSSRVGDWVPTCTVKAFNRTGGTLSRGQVAQMDFAKAAAETINAEAGDEASVFANLVAPSAGAGLSGYPMVLVVDVEIEDDALGEVLLYGLGEVSAKDNATATTNVTDGGFISVAGAGDADVEGAAAGDRIMGVAFADGAASGGPTLVPCMWNGGALTDNDA